MNDNILRWSCGEPALPGESYQQHVDRCPWMRRYHPNDLALELDEALEDED